MVRQKCRVRRVRQPARQHCARDKKLNANSLRSTNDRTLGSGASPHQRCARRGLPMRLTRQCFCESAHDSCEFNGDLRDSWPFGAARWLARTAPVVLTMIVSEGRSKPRIILVATIRCGCIVSGLRGMWGSAKKRVVDRVGVWLFLFLFGGGVDVDWRSGAVGKVALDVM